MTRLGLRNFRCHRSLDLVVAPESVVLVGANGSGKTSVLEALSLLAPGRGLRRARLAEMLRGGGGEAASAWSVSARLRSRSGPMDVVTAFTTAESAGRDGRRVSIDGQPTRGRSALARAVNLVWLTPEMNRLFVGGPAGRRRFLDRLVWGVDPMHASRVSAYERAMQQRSTLLRQENADAAWLGALEETMATHGVAVAAARRQATAQLNELARAPLDGFPAALISTRGSLEDWLDEVPALAAEELMRSALAGARRKDAETGGSAFGPHLSDMVVLYGESGRPASECSAGEQKMLLIAIVLAGARLQKHERGASPLMLLDDVVAHLDVRHRHAVFEAVADLAAQAWYTGTDRGPFQPLAHRAQFVALDDPGGSWTREGEIRGRIERRSRDE